MSLHDPLVRVRHMLDSACEAIALCRGRGASDLENDRLLELSLLHLITILGEAASQVPPAVRALHPDVPWARAISMRNRIVHGYDSVDREILWSTVREDLPQLASSLEKALSG
ncbi:DUF86 domain-containing protein [Acidobacteria bacterium ACD]|nr:MAG: DUF86 domain-containing protein [Acidobacteriota bacterium]MCE7958184.1 DUF86 domain-containing protein [Acidobacteria bacterium ACB2]MDL1949775.1 DUF86 domain-containing protein [Acidobacteria bacterium ACD]